MIKNYFKTSLAYLRSHKTFSLINITGLAVGICVCFFALLYVRFELSRDSYNIQADSIYRIVTDIKTPTGTDYESTPAPLAPALQAVFPEIKVAARVFMDDMIIQSNPGNATKEEIAYADSSVFKIFTWPLLRGKAGHLFDAPFNVVVSESAAKKYFGAADPLGQTLTINGGAKATVTGIMKDIPYNSHLRVDMLFSMSTLLDADWDRNWTRFGFYTYILVSPHFNAAAFSAKLPGFVKANFDQSKLKYQLQAEPLKRVYLYGKPRGHRTGASASGSISNIYIVSVIAVLVLVIACFNFINLTTAFSLQRAKEIGVRKVLGASQNQLIIQFFADALLLCLVAFAIALGLAVLLLPLYNQVTGITITQHVFENLTNIIWLLAIAVAVGLLSGIYPALYLSQLKPISSLKGKFETEKGGLFLRKTLVVAQFSISIFLIIATIVVYRQVDFMQNRQLGFEKGHKLVIDFQFDNRIVARAGTIKQKLALIPGVTRASMSYSVPGTPGNQYPTTTDNSSGEKQQQRADAYFIDGDFINQYQLAIIAGRNFSKNTDTMSTMLVNEAMVKSLGYAKPEDIIGKHFFQLNHEGTIIGVVKDFHFHSFAEKIQPLTMRLNPGFFTFLTIDIAPENVRSTISRIENTWKNFAPGLPFVYFFADEAYNQQYIAQQRFGRLFICFAAIAVAISCLGLLGLSAYATTQRRKEIGIRKVLGATVSGIAAMLSKDFIKPIIIALLITSPVSWWLMNSWLQNFAYRINIPFWTFILSGLAAIMIALFTISFHAIKAALVNPVKSLKE